MHVLRPHPASFLAMMLGISLLTSSSVLLHAEIFTGPGFNFVDATSAQSSGRGRAFGDIVIQNNPGTVQLINSVTLTSLTHTHLGDLRIDLTHLGTGQNVILTSPPEGVTTNFNGTYTFLVEATLPTVDMAVNGLGNVDLPSGQYAMSAFAPVGGRTNFEAFVGIPIEGTWRLGVVDFFPGDTGALGSWSFNANIVAVPEPTSLLLMGFAVAIPVARYRRKTGRTSSSL